MADTQPNARTADPFLAARFWVEIDGIVVGGFTECSGFKVETEVESVREGGLNRHVHLLPKGTKWSNIVLKRGWVANTDLWDWYQSTINGRHTVKTVSILMFEYHGSSNSEAAYRWDLSGAFPIKWTGPDYKADSTAVAVETLELAHNGWTGSAG